MNLGISRAPFALRLIWAGQQQHHAKCQRHEKGNHVVLSALRLLPRGATAIPRFASALLAHACYDYCCCCMGCYNTAPLDGYSSGCHVKHLLHLLQVLAGARIRTRVAAKSLALKPYGCGPGPKPEHTLNITGVYCHKSTAKTCEKPSLLKGE